MKSQITLLAGCKTAILMVLFTCMGLSDQLKAQGPVMVKDIRPGTSSSTCDYLANINGALFFRVTNAGDGLGSELWKSDGTPGGTVMIKDIRTGSPSSFPVNMTDVNGVAFFVADDGVAGNELWKSDGTAAGTIMVKDILPGASGSFGFLDDPFFTNVNGIAFFTVDDGTTGMELWKSDGTAAGTVLVKDINPGNADSNPHGLIHVNGILYFKATNGTNGVELWKSDGTAAGTVMVKDIMSGTASSSPGEFTIFNNLLFFRASGTTGAEIWKSDGTAVGTVTVAGGFNYITGITKVNTILFFSGSLNSSNRELWKSDGTTAGTVLVKDIYPGSQGSTPYHIININGVAFFKANNGTDGQELWKSDGTSAGTIMVKDINPGSGSSMSNSGVANSYFTNMNDTLFFIANDGTNGAELWKSDGTTAGTVMYDINPGTISSGAIFPTNVNGVLYFSAGDPANGAELWKYPGTSAGTGTTTTDISSVMENNRLALYPNPSNGIFQMRANQTAFINVNIYNVLGEKVYSSTKQEITNFTIDLSNQPAGTYLARVVEADKIYTFKLLVQD